jgi:hypothetical protein
MLVPEPDPSHGNAPPPADSAAGPFLGSEPRASSGLLCRRSHRDLELSLILEGGPESGRAYKIGPTSREISLQIWTVNPGSHMQIDV